MRKETFPWRRARTFGLALALGAVAVPAGVGAATTYYIDFDGGDDTASGTSVEAPFRRAPGDPEAGGRAAAVELTPGDTVLFKGGVRYRGVLRIRWAGTAEAPIVYDGNTAGTFGEGPAILDGSEPLDGWRRCASAAEAGGHPDYARIWTTTIPVEDGLTAAALGLVQGERMLYPAQYPNPQDAFYRDRVATDYLEADGRMTRTSITDSRLAALGGEALVGGLACVFVVRNDVQWRRITGFDAARGTLTIEPLERDPAGRFALANTLVPAVFDTPGEYVLGEADGEGRRRLFVLPHADPAREPIARVVRSLAIDLGRAGSDHVTIQGFDIRDYRLALRAREVTGLTVRGNRIARMRQGGYTNALQVNRVRDALFESNVLEYLPQMRGIVTHTGERVAVVGNRLDHVGRSPLVFYFVDPGRIVGNTLTHCTGMHSNAITIYEQSRNILVANNRVRESSLPMTVQNSENVYVIQNVFETRGTAVGLWPGRPLRNLVFLNNLLLGGGTGIFVNHDDVRESTFVNNILTGIDGIPLGEGHTMAHNLYLSRRAHLHEGEFVVEDVDRVLVDAAGGNPRPEPTGPAVDMGTDVSALWPREQFPGFDFDRDVDGRPRVHGARIDIGPWEVAYAPGALDGREPIATGVAALPVRPIDAETPVEGADPIVIRALDFSGEGGGAVRPIAPDTQASVDFIRFWNDEGHWLDYDVEAPEAGDYALALRYTCEFEAPRRVEVNGRPVAGLEASVLPATGGWQHWRMWAAPAPLPLREGSNRIRLISLGGRGCNLDEIRLTRPDVAPIAITAGSLAGQGGGTREVETVPSPHAGLFFAWNVDGHWLEWTVDAPEAGRFKVVVRYATLSTSPRGVSVNGRTVEGLESVILERTEGWRHCAEAVLPAPIELTAGRNTIRFTSLGGGGMNFDEIRLLPLQ